MDACRRTRLTSAEASDSSKYRDWSFGTDWNVQSSGSHQNIWYTDETGAHLTFEKPCAYACTTETKNGIDARITSISLSQPQSITPAKVITTDITGVTAEIPVELPAERSALFMNIPCDIELDALTASYKIVTEYTEASLTLGDTAQAEEAYSGAVSNDAEYVKLFVWAQDMAPLTDALIKKLHECKKQEGQVPPADCRAMRSVVLLVEMRGIEPLTS